MIVKYNTNSINKTNKKFICIYKSSQFDFLFREKGIDAYCIFKEISFFIKPIRKIFRILKLPLTLFYDQWKKQIKIVDTVVAFDGVPSDILEYIKSKNPSIRIISWYWNPVSAKCVEDPKTISDSLCEKWSFDEFDCKKYGMKFNTTFYFNNIKLPVYNIKYDVFFLGLEKNRSSILHDLQNQIKTAGLIPYFYVVDNDALEKGYKGLYPAISYNQNLLYIAQSRAILDVLQENQSGMSLRPMEALFLKKKLITTQKGIISCDFYHPDNIFIWGVDDLNNLRQFLHKPLYNVPKEIIDRYDVCNWLLRFNEKKQP